MKSVFGVTGELLVRRERCMRIESGETAVIAIDYQEKLVPAMNNSEKWIDRSVMLLKGLAAMKLPVILTQQYTKGLGETIADVRYIDGMPDGMEKISFSCIMNQQISKKLDRMNVDNVILCGCEAHICVLQTAIDLVSEGYDVYIVADCVASRSETDKQYAITRAVQEGVKITSAEAVLYELMQSASHEAFKYISALVKQYSV